MLLLSVLIGCVCGGVGGEGKITLSSKILMFFSHVEIHS